MVRTRVIDMHSHILPGVDDGSADMETTKKMLQIAWEDGITDIIATPHYQRGRFQVKPEVLKEILREVQEEAFKINKEFHIYLGSEVYAASNIVDDIRRGRIMTMGESEYVLVEFMTESGFSEIQRIMSGLRMNGFWPILAHAERYRCLRTNPDNVKALKEIGVLIQINAGSVMGKDGWGARMFTRSLLKRKEVDFVGTDAHSARKRRPELTESMDYVQRKIGRGYARRIYYDNAEMVLNNAMI